MKTSPLKNKLTQIVSYLKNNSFGDLSIDTRHDQLCFIIKIGEEVIFRLHGKDMNDLYDSYASLLNGRHVTQVQDYFLYLSSQILDEVNEQDRILYLIFRESL